LNQAAYTLAEAGRELSQVVEMFRGVSGVSTGVSEVVETLLKQQPFSQSASVFQGVSEVVETPLKQQPSPAIQKAMDWIKLNPDQAEFSVRQVAQMSGCSPSAIVRARKLLAEGNNQK
jgi:hypothetical protein